MMRHTKTWTEAAVRTETVKAKKKFPELKTHLKMNGDNGRLVLWMKFTNSRSCHGDHKDKGKVFWKEKDTDDLRMSNLCWKILYQVDIIFFFSLWPTAAMCSKILEVNLHVLSEIDFCSEFHSWSISYKSIQTNMRRLKMSKNILRIT